MDYRVSRTFFPSGWYFFYPVTTDWIFCVSYVRIQSIKNQVDNEYIIKFNICLVRYRMISYTSIYHIASTVRVAIQYTLYIVHTTQVLYCSTYLCPLSYPLCDANDSCGCGKREIWTKKINW